MADLLGAMLNRADLRGASLIEADLRGVSLGLADLRGADLTEAYVDEVLSRMVVARLAEIGSRLVLF